MNQSEYRALSDPELVALCLKGDSQAWEALIMRYRRLIYSVPVRFGFTPADSSDVFQTLCLKLLEHLHEVKDENKLSSWLITTTTRHCLHTRSLKYREIGTDQEFHELPDPGDNLEDLSIIGEQQQAVRMAVEQLSGRCESLIQMLYFDPRSPSYEEIGRVLSMPVASIGPTRARCLDKLRTMLRRQGIK